MNTKALLLDLNSQDGWNWISLWVVDVINKFHLGHEGNMNGLIEINDSEYGKGSLPRSLSLSLKKVCFVIKATKECGQKTDFDGTST